MFWRFFAIAITACAIGFGAVTAAAAPASPSDAAGSKAAEAFLRSAEALYQAVAGGSGGNVRRLLRETESRFRALPMDQIGSAEGIEALARSIARMKRLTAAISPDETEWTAAAAEIRLAADALAHPGHPVWHGYRSVLREDISLISAGLAQSDPTGKAAAGLRRLKAHYGLIRTAVLLHGEPSMTERADSVLRYAERVLNAPKPDQEWIKNLIPSLTDAMDGLFPQARKETAALVSPVGGPPWGWSALMGSFIVTVLSWAGWQRYRGIEPVIPRESLPPEHRERR